MVVERLEGIMACSFEGTRGLDAMNDVPNVSAPQEKASLIVSERNQGSVLR